MLHLLHDLQGEELSELQQGPQHSENDGVRVGKQEQCMLGTSLSITLSKHGTDQVTITEKMKEQYSGTVMLILSEVTKWDKVESDVVDFMEKQKYETSPENVTNQS